jgi:hypothetical protein
LRTDIRGLRLSCRLIWKSENLFNFPSPLSAS